MDLMEIKMFNVMPGASINDVAKEAITIAKKNNCIVKFNFNSKNITVYRFDSEEDIYNRYYK